MFFSALYKPQELKDTFENIETKIKALLNNLNSYEYVENGSYQIDKDKIVEEIEKLLLITNDE